MTIKDQQPPLALTMLRVFVEVLNPFKAQFVVRPSVLANSDSPGYRDTSIVPGRLVKLAIEDDKRRDCPSSCINRLDRGNPFPVPWLFCPWSALPV